MLKSSLTRCILNWRSDTRWCWKHPTQTVDQPQSLECTREHILVLIFLLIVIPLIHVLCVSSLIQANCTIIAKTNGRMSRDPTWSWSHRWQLLSSQGQYWKHPTDQLTRPPQCFRYDFKKKLMKLPESFRVQERANKACPPPKYLDLESFRKDSNTVKWRLKRLDHSLSYRLCNTCPSLKPGKILVSLHPLKRVTLPKALRTQALTALTSSFGLVGLVQYAW